MVSVSYPKICFVQYGQNTTNVPQTEINLINFVKSGSANQPVCVQLTQCFWCIYISTKRVGFSSCFLKHLKNETIPK